MAIRSIRRCVKWRSLTLLSLVIVCVPWAFGAKDFHKNYRLLSRFWLPYEPDPEAVGLFHLDQGRKRAIKDIEKLENAADDPLAALAPAKREDDGAAGANVLDSSLLKRNARVVEPFSWAKEGRLGNALRLDGPKSALVTPTYTEIRGGKAFSVEAWIKPDGGKKTTVFSCESFDARKSVIDLEIRPDGFLHVLCGGRDLGKVDRQLAAGHWWHVLFVASPPRTVPTDFAWAPAQVGAQIQVLVDGTRAFEVEDKGIEEALRQFRGSVRVGNVPAGGSTFNGLIDEVRVSSGLREVYPLDVDWVDPRAKRPLPVGPPYLRDGADVTFVVPFEGSTEPTVDSGAEITQPVWPGGYQPQPPPNPEYAPGVRGQALVVEPGRRMHVYTAGRAVDARRGSVEFWFRPWDWDNRKQQTFHDPMEFTNILRIEGAPDPTTRKAEEFCAFGIYRKMPMDKPRPPMIHSGHWYHIVGTWDDGQTRIYMNGEPMHPSAGYWRVAKPAEGVKPALIALNPFPHWITSGKTTCIDELRLYNRALTPEEVANAYARYRPRPVLKPLPFAHVDVTMNYPLKTLSLGLELLSPKRGDVGGVALEAFNPDLFASGELTKIVNGRAEITLKPVAVGYGLHRVELAFKDKAGAAIDRMEITENRVRPPWLGNRLGIHEGEVLPEWPPMTVEGAAVRCWGREIKMGGSGLPESIVSQREDILAAPIRVALGAGGKPVALKADGAPSVVEARKDVVVTKGSQSGGGMRVDTQIRTEFDGMMRVECMLTPAAATTLDSLRIEIPLHSRNARFIGFWTGHRNFRASTDYRLLPEGQGVLFRSNKPGRAVAPELVGSFIPYLFLGDDYRGLAWFAENDKGWTKSKEVSALEVVRDKGVTTLVMNVVHAPVKLDGPVTFVFGLQPVPVKARDANGRAMSSALNFGFVDSFSKQHLKSNNNGVGSFNIYPSDYDWKAAKVRADLHREFYGSTPGYQGPILYIDRNWVGLPPSANEFRGIWYGSGFFRYLRDAADCHIWNLDQWLKHKLVRGFYIDDIWIGHFKDPETGPGYRMADGKIQPGFEFFDYHAYMKRLRWIFHDNHQTPLIWVHMTQTFFIPCFSFADVYLDGEDRFLNWYDKRDFIVMWGLPRLRFNNGKKWGLTPVFMNKIGNDNQPRTPAPHWFYGQQRSYVAGLLVHDIQPTGGAGGAGRDLQRAGCCSNDARFVGYWEPQSPVKCEPAGVVASVYLSKDHAALFIVNGNADAAECTLTLDPQKLGLGVQSMKELVVEDCDTYEKPKGEDITKLKLADQPKVAGIGEDDTALEREFANIKDKAEKDEEKEKGLFKFDDHNFRRAGNAIRLRVRGHDYRLLVVKRKTGGTE